MFVMVGTRSVIDVWDTVKSKNYWIENSDADLTWISSISRFTLFKSMILCEFFTPRLVQKFFKAP